MVRIATFTPMEVWPRGGLTALKVAIAGMEDGNTAMCVRTPRRGARRSTAESCDRI